MAVLDELIQKHVAIGICLFLTSLNIYFVNIKGTHICTDSWKGYNNLKNLGYTHSTVNHTKVLH